MIQHLVKRLPCLLLVLITACAARQSQPRTHELDLAWTPRQAAQANRLRARSGADGVTEAATLAGSPCLRLRPGSLYLYFAVESDRPLRGPVYVTVEYFDDAAGSPVALQYDSATGDDLAARYRPAEETAGGWRLGGGKWRTAIFLMKDAQFAHRQNLGADFRLQGSGLAVRSVRLSRARPANWEDVDRMQATDVKPLVKIGAGGQLIVGGFDPARVADAAPTAHSLEAAVPPLKLLGVTSHEGYVRWNLCEPQPGRYDWSVYDRFVAIYKRHHLKWVPFLIIGSAYSLPDWYYRKPGSQGYVCLEHGQESDVQSLWSPALRGHVAGFLKAFCEHYRGTGVIESILLGITGNYGEAIYPATGNDWTADIHGPYHTHAGYWAGDRFAVASFRDWLRRKYRDTAGLRKAWGTQAPEIDQAKPFLRNNAPSDRAWLDFVAWYIGSITDWARFWLHETRRNFPKGDIYLCTGGHAPPEHGSDFGDQCKTAAEVGGGVRITNEGSDYRDNFSLTRWVASAGRQYGAYFSFEPAGGVDANGVVARIYNGTASGARGLHYYYPNLFDSEAARRNFVRYGSDFKQRKPVVEIAAYYPETWIRMHGNDFLRLVQPLRDRFDFDFMSDGQIADGGLKQIRALILLEGSIAEGNTWRAIADWIRGGGLLLYPEGMGKFRTVEGEEWPYTSIMGANANRGRGRALGFNGRGDSSDYRAFLAHALASAPELSAASRAMVTADGAEDGLFVTLCAPGDLLWLNTTGQQAQKGSAILPAYGMAEERLRGAER